MDLTKPRLALLPLVATLSGLFFCVHAQADETVPRAGTNPKVVTEPALKPGFSWNQSDYVVRCADAPVKASLTVPDGWKARVATAAFRSGDFQVTKKLKEGRAYSVTFRTPAGRDRVFHIRCLPMDFPRFRVQVSRPGAPRLTVVNLGNRYAVAFDDGGAPVWWYRHDAGPENPEIMANGAFSIISVRNLAFEQFQVRSLNGQLIRSILPQGDVLADSHDFQRLPSGNFLFGNHRRIPFNATAFGGLANGVLDTAQIQEVRPNGSLVWKWNSYPRIKPAETGRWWDVIRPWGVPYDHAHWNSVDRKGRYVLLSFRHLDAVYKIDRRSGRIVWKLGGTRTSKSLKVKGDPYGRYPFGGQHDARFMPDGSVTIFDNQTYFEKRQPRAVRYMINEKKRTATLIREIKDPLFKVSIGFGSARIGRNGNWLICWGATGKDGNVAAYDPQGRAFFRIYTPAVTPYRANPVYSPKPTIGQIRRAMNQVASN